MAETHKSIAGIHHITAITSDAQKNIDFYCGVLGLRLAKLTVNFDDPGSYHLYYGDDLGRPGSILTFFAWPGAYRGRVGPPQVTETAFAVPKGWLEFWIARLKDKGVAEQAIVERFGEKVLPLADFDGMWLELIETSGPMGPMWNGGGIAAENAIHGFHSATISEEGYENTARLLTEVMGFSKAENHENRFRYIAAAAGPAAKIDLLCVPGARQGSMGAGIVHHIAFRAKDDAQQAAWRNELVRKNFNVSPVMDRCYFHSIYYREPGGVLFEIATDNPGFTADQSAEELGKKLMLPPWLEAHRGEIEKIVPPVRLP
jgi:catechol 2,3-dioxygenase-like lactoylglutathione lyase family enzyme